MVKIDVTQSPLSLSGTPFKDERGQLQTLRDILINTLANVDVEKNFTPKQKMKFGKLAERIYENDEVGLDADEVSKLKEMVGDGYTNTVLVMKVWEILDPPVESEVSELDEAKSKKKKKK